uniref:choice-of-anchor L domain-containing protein n=1 Tax=Flavobacterium aerium TaxID=3037261 RepID=UPI00278BC366
IGVPGTTLFTGIMNCTPPLCKKPKNLTATGITQSGALLGWTEAGSATSWDIVVQAENGPVPTAATLGTGTTAQPYPAGGLNSGSPYEFYVRANCGGANGKSTWTGPFKFRTLIANDECATATPVPVNPASACIQSVAGTVIGATASSQANTCGGSADDDVWFQFVATSTSHTIDLSNIAGSTTNLSMAVYSGTQCGTLSLLYCGTGNSTYASNFVIGQTYKIRVYTATATINQTTTFNICVGTLLPPITVTNNQHTVQQLVENVLISSPCPLVSNIQSSTGTNYGGTNGIGYFEKNGSSFAFNNGIVLSSGNALTTAGPETGTQGGNDGYDWLGDPDLEAAILAGTGISMDSYNATYIEFDFVPIISAMSFNFIFGSDEYGSFQCGTTYSDAFAFLLTGPDGVTTNLAVVPGTPIPVSVNTISNSLFNNSCSSQNPTFFDSYYGYPNGQNELADPLNLRGYTTPMIASATVIPGQTYHIKMVIADRGDPSYDTAVFLDGGSFDIGNVNLGANLLVSEGNALCAGQTHTLDSGFDPALYVFTWYLNNVVITGATGPSIVASESGIYKLEALFVGTQCTASDEVIVEFYDNIEVITGAPVDLSKCSAASTGTFNLTQNNDLLLLGLDPAFYTVTFYTSQADADAEIAPIATPMTYTNISNPQQIFVKVIDNASGCKGTKSFQLILQDLSPTFTLAGETALCPTATSAITATLATPTTGVTYAWTLPDGTLATEISNVFTVPANTYGIYSLTASFGECTFTDTFEITMGNANLDFTFSGDQQICANETTVINVVPGNFDPATVTYSWELPDGSVSPVTASSLPITAGAFGVYTVTVNSNGCTVDKSFTIAQDNTAWNFTYNGPYAICSNGSVSLTITPTNFNISDPNAVYTWTLPDGSTSTVTTPTIVATVIGTYTLKVNISGCEGQSSVTVTENTNSFAVNVEQGCQVNPVNGQIYAITVSPVNNSYDPNTATYIWTMGTTVVGNDDPLLNVTSLVNDNTQYPLTINVKVKTAEGCEFNQAVVVDGTFCKIPKGISPNNDGLNDKFDLTGLGVRHLSIFNRYGTKVYSYSNYTDQWHGQSEKGNELPDGTYYYVIEKSTGSETGWVYINRERN